MKRAVITGATKGIGRAIALALAKASYDLAICARTEFDLKRLEHDIFQINPDAEVLCKTTDVGDYDQLAAFTTKIQGKWNHIDILINNAGIFIPGKVTEEKDGLLLKMLNVNLMSAYHLTRMLMPLIKASPGGHIFNVCSVASVKAYPNGGSYSISKFALLGLSKALREELMQDKIKVTAIIPGATYTDSWKGVDIPQSRFMQSDDIAEAVMSALRMSPGAVVEEITLRPQLGDI